MFAEDMFDSLLTELKELTASLDASRIHEVWRVWSIDRKSFHHVVLFDETCHLCTCLTLVSHGLVCRHFFCVMTLSLKARFHIGLIPERWYSKRVRQTSEAAISCLSEDGFGTFEHIISPEFTHIDQIRGCHVFTATVQEEMSKRQLWGRGFGMMKRALNLAISTGHADELYDFHKTFADKIEQEIATKDGTENDDLLSVAARISNPLKVQTKGQKSKRLKAFNDNAHSKKVKKNHHSTLIDITNTSQGNYVSNAVFL